MNRDNYIKVFSGLVIVMLIISLIMNINLVSKMDELRNEMNHLSNNQYDIMNSVSNQAGHIQDVMKDIREEQSWIGRINMEVNTGDPISKENDVVFEWQIKELHDDSEVVLNYTYGNNDDFKTIPAEEIEQGIFQVKVPLELNLEPQWEVGLMGNDGASQDQLIKEEMEKRRKEDQNILKYYVSVSHDDLVKSGQMHEEHLGHYGTSQYGFIQADIDIREEFLGITLVNHEAGYETNLIDEAYLLMYENESLIGEEEFTTGDHNAPEGRGIRFLQVENVEIYEDMRLVVKVVYSNGETFEREVYQKN